ncbi:MAG: DNA-binding response regulator [Verrucomicrobia bacterium]|nr:DNA-binding response regulator [Verrucomicrobiota bacterium]
MLIRIALVEDDAPFANTLAEYFQLSQSVQCVAIFPDAECALGKIPELKPDVILMDINLPKMNGIELVARLKETSPSLLCLMLTMYEETNLIFDALKAGACGYLLKRTPPGEIVTALEQVHAGGSAMSPQIARQVVSFFHRATIPASSQLEALTERERSVLDLLSKGFLYKQIGDKLGISLDTVRSHLRKVYEKLHVHSRTEAVLKYLGKQ